MLSGMLARLIHEPLVWEIGQPLLALPSLNKLIWFDFDLQLYYATSAVAKERPEQDCNTDLCDAGAVLYQLSYGANLDLAAVSWKTR